MANISTQKCTSLGLTELKSSKQSKNDDVFIMGKAELTAT